VLAALDATLTDPSSTFGPSMFGDMSAGRLGKIGNGYFAGRPEGTNSSRRADELIMTAVTLFASQGYAETTIGEIAAAAGMPERSFFWYFDTKEDVVLRGFELMGQALADHLAELPPDMPAWSSLRAAFEAVADYYDQDPERNLAVIRLRSNTPALIAHYLEQRSRWQELMVPHLLARLAGGRDDGAPVQPDPRPHAVAGAALACLGAAETAWMQRDASVSLSTLLDLAMGALSPLTAEDTTSSYLTR
jgi:AcrR family transcriptional regulator